MCPAMKETDAYNIYTCTWCSRDIGDIGLGLIPCLPKIQPPLRSCIPQPPLLKDCGKDTGKTSYFTAVGHIPLPFYNLQSTLAFYMGLCVVRISLDPSAVTSECDNMSPYSRDHELFKLSPYYTRKTSHQSPVTPVTRTDFFNLFEKRRDSRWSITSTDQLETKVIQLKSSLFIARVSRRTCLSQR